MLRNLAVAWIALHFSSSALAAQDPEKGDLRDISVGVAVADLPAEGYVKHRCAGDAGRDATEIAGWSNFEQCPAAANGLREIAFEFDESKAQWASVNDRWEGTRVSGHPVMLSLLIDADGKAQALHINTDPSARAYMRKKAFLLRLRVWGRYGRDGWACTEATPGKQLSAVGGMLINETCTKAFAGRELTLTTRLYRSAGQSASEFTNATRLEIVWAGGT